MTALERQRKRALSPRTVWLSLSPTTHQALLWIARAGFAGRGAVFLVLGGLAVMAVLGNGSLPDGTTGVFFTVLRSPGGWALLLLMTAGLLCFAIFRGIEATFDVHNYGSDILGILHRLALGAGGLAYAGLAIAAFSIVVGWRMIAGGDQAIRDWTAWLLGFPGGIWLVGAAGLTTIGLGVGLSVSGCRASFRQRVKVDAEARPYVRVLGIIGFVSRSVIFMLIGGFLVFAAVTADPGQVQGFGGALRAIQHQPYGEFLLGAMALGFIAFGLFGLSEALFATLNPQAREKHA